NRQSSTLLQVFQKYVIKGSICITDGFPSYTSTVSNFKSRHEVVNYSVGFVNQDGANTNQIENLWSHLKQEYRSRKGINHLRMPHFLKEFSWRKKNIDNSKQNSLKDAFVKFLSLFIHN
ncbi:hypothetical protein DMUE_5510, partial [Dictyocoela muelleri]